MPEIVHADSVTGPAVIVSAVAFHRTSAAWFTVVISRDTGTEEMKPGDDTT